MREFLSRGADETFAFALDLAGSAAPGGVYCLTGPMGAGKTVFAKGFAKGLGVAESVTSPTFAIVNEYRGRLPLYHFDVFRVGCVSEMDDAGYEEYFYGDGVCVIEWAELVSEIIPENAVWVTIDTGVGDTRVITVNGRPCFADSRD